MATFTKYPLSGSTNGRPIAVAATAIATGTTIHTAVAGTTNWDEIWLFANNITTLTIRLTIGWGGTGNSDLNIIDIPPNQGKVLIAAGELLQNGLVIKAAAKTANVVNITGFVNRITA
mgnify:CR=1 FL=1